MEVRTGGADTGKNHRGEMVFWALTMKGRMKVWDPVTPGKARILKNFQVQDMCKSMVEKMSEIGR